MKIEAIATSGTATGKSFILRKVQQLLQTYGFELDDFYEPEDKDQEILEMTRKDDRLHFIKGQNRLTLGDWAIDLDQNNQLVALFYKGQELPTTDITVEFAPHSMPLIKVSTIALERDCSD